MLAQEDEFNLTKEQERWVVGIMLGVTLVKLLLVFYCRTFTNEIVKAYAQDHFFDVITNIIGLVAVLLANYIDDWMDPVGAIIVSKSPLTWFFVFFLVLVCIVLAGGMNNKGNNVLLVVTRTANIRFSIMAWIL